jgi:hypothetical protein
LCLNFIGDVQKDITVDAFFWFAQLLAPFGVVTFAGRDSTGKLCLFVRAEGVSFSLGHRLPRVWDSLYAVCLPAGGGKSHFVFEFFHYYYEQGLLLVDTDQFKNDCDDCPQFVNPLLCASREWKDAAMAGESWIWSEIAVTEGYLLHRFVAQKADEMQRQGIAFRGVLLMTHHVDKALAAGVPPENILVVKLPLKMHMEAVSARDYPGKEEGIILAERNWASTHCDVIPSHSALVEKIHQFLRAQSGEYRAVFKEKGVWTYGEMKKYALAMQVYIFLRSTEHVVWVYKNLYGVEGVVSIADARMASSRFKSLNGLSGIPGHPLWSLMSSDTAAMQLIYHCLAKCGFPSLTSPREQTRHFDGPVDHSTKEYELVEAKIVSMRRQVRVLFLSMNFARRVIRIMVACPNSPVSFRDTRGVILYSVPRYIWVGPIGDLGILRYLPAIVVVNDSMSTDEIKKKYDYASQSFCVNSISARSIPSVQCVVVKSTIHDNPLMHEGRSDEYYSSRCLFFDSCSIDPSLASRYKVVASVETFIRHRDVDSREAL